MQSDGASGGASDGSPTLDRRLCQVVGVNQNCRAQSGTPYHIQIEDRGPVMDRLREVEVRRVNVIVYANYGESNARIVHGRDHDFPDLRTQEYNRVIAERIQELATQARDIIEEHELRQVFRIKGLIREYYLTRNEEHKREFEQANAAYPFLFSRAFRELKAQRPGAAVDQAQPVLPAVEPEPEAPPTEVLYPLDPELRESVLDIERVIIELGHDLQRLKASGQANDILLQTCRKLVVRAKESLSGRDMSEFNARRLEMTRNSLLTTWRQVRSLLK
jgi:hypothetical protein